LSGSDPNEDELEFFIENEPIHGIISLNNNVINYTPDFNYYGLDNFTFYASDGEWISETGIINIDIEAVNDAPIVTNIALQTNEDQDIAIELIGTDIDSEILTYEIIDQPSLGTLTYEDNMVIFNPYDNLYGSDSFSYIANDGELTSNSANVNITILPINDSPVLLDIPNNTINEGDIFQYALQSEDIDGDQIYYSASVNGNAALDILEEVLFVTPNSGFNGYIDIEVIVTDGLESDSQTFTLEVLPVNDPPELAFIGSKTIDEDTDLEINLSADDIDGDNLIFSADVDENANININNDILIISPEDNYYGDIEVTVSVSDGEFSDSELFILTVLPVNDQPLLSEISDNNIYEGEVFEYILEAYDIDGDDLIFVATSDNNTVITIDDNELSVFPDNDFNGNIEITITVYDNSSSDSKTFTLGVLPINDPPELAFIGSKITDEDTDLEINLSANDIDGDNLIFSADVDANANININNDILIISPEDNYYGDIEVTASVSDGEFSDSESFILTVLPINDDPFIINTIDDLEVLEGSETVIIDLSDIFYDLENGNDLGYTAYESISALEVYISGNQLYLNFNEEQFGSGEVIVTASDNISRAVASTSFYVDIIEQNDPPQISDMNLNVYEDEDIEFFISAYDIENDELSYAILNYPDYGNIQTVSESEYIYTPNSNYYGNDILTISVSDGVNTVDSHVYINIIAVNDSPVFDTAQIQDAIENTDYDQEIIVNDIDNNNNELSLSIISAPYWLNINNFNLSGIPSFNDDGDYDIILELYDGISSSSINYSLTVINQNQPPVVSNIDLTTFEETEISFNLEGNDSENDDLSFIYSEPEHGQLIAEGTLLTYTPNSDFYGNDSFTYYANDGINDSNIGVINIQIVNINDAPEAQSVDFDVLEDPFSFNLDDYLYDADFNEDEFLTFSSVPPSQSENVFQTMFGGEITLNSGYNFSYSLPENITPSDFLLYKVSDGITESTIEIITFNLYGRTWPRNSPPSAFDDNVNLEEDNLIELTLVGFDVYYPFPQDGTEIVNIISQPVHGSLIGEAELQNSDLENLAQWKIGYQPDNDYSGLDSVIYEVDNPNNEFGESSQAVIYININESNDLPYIEGISDQEMLEDSIGSIPINYFDVDNDLSISVSSSNENISVSLDEDLDNIIVDSLDDYYGSGYVSLTITETEGDELSISETFNIEVLPVNDAPILSDIEDQIINEDEFLLLSLSASDIDYVSYEFEATSSDNLIIDIDNNLLQISGVENYYGDESILVKVIDNEGALDSQYFDITILPVNDPPILLEIIVPNIEEDDSYSLSIEVIDVDNNDFSFSVTDIDNISITIDEYILTESGGLQWITISPEPNWHGNRAGIISVNDGEYTNSQQITINVESVNDAPEISIIPTQTINEDENIDIFIDGEDIDGDEIIYSIISSGSYSTSIIGNTISIQPDENYNGEIELLIDASDGYMNSQTSFTLEVEPVNDPPSINSISDQEINEGSIFLYELTADDIDGDQLNYSIIEINNGATGSFYNNIVTITPENTAWNGDINITIGIDDGEYSDFTSFILSVINVNDPPVAQSQNIETNEDSPIAITLGASDPDGDFLIFEISDSPSHGSISQQDNIIIYNPEPDYFGEDFITFFANDGEYVSSIETINININSINDPPQLAAIQQQIINEGGELVYQLGITDDNHEEIDIELIADENINYSISSGYVLTLSTIDPNFYGELDVNIQISDSEYSITNILDIIINPINDSPVLSSIDDMVINEDETLTYSIIADDIDNDNLVFDIQSIPNGTIELTNNLLTFIPELNFNGSIDISVYVTDGEYTDSETFTVLINPINDPPILESIGNQNIDEDDMFTYIIDVTDPEDDLIIYSLEADTTNAMINLENNIIFIFPNLNWYGDIIISVNISDGEYSDSESFILKVDSVNDTPVITSTPIFEAYEDIEYIYEIAIEDPDNDSFEYFIINGPDGMSISDEGIISWIPSEGVLSSGLVGLVVWDTYPPGEYDIPAYQEFTINVVPVNDAPVIVSSAPSNAVEDILYEYIIDIEDPDSDNFSISLINGPEDMEITDNILSWIPLEGIISSGIVTISVTDDNIDDPLSDIQNFMVTVTPINDPPLIVSIPDSEAFVGELYQYQVIIEDPDDDIFTYILINHPDGMEINTSGLLQWTPPSAGVFGPIVIEAFDGGEDGVESAQQLFIVVAEHISPLITMEFNFNQTANLISFLGVPEDSLISSVFEPLGDNALALIGGGEAAQHLPNDLWVGSLQTISPTSGYWLKLEEPGDELIIEAYPTDPEIIYNLSEGQNLISYIGNDNLYISDAISDDIEELFLTIIAEGQAAQRLPNGLWVGSLTHLNTLKGYWVKISDDIDFQWNYNEDLIRNSYNYQNPKEYLDLDEFEYNQSMKQGFYFFKNITIDDEELKDDDWVIAYKDDIVVGYSKYSGQFMDVPVMGFDGYPNTYNYCKNGDIPIFKVFRESSGELIDMTPNNNFRWSDNEIYNIESLSEYILPENHMLLDAYPNPFNPVTSISFEVSEYSDTQLSVYNINGQLIDIIVEGKYEPGYYTHNWNAQDYSSGIYFIKLNINNDYQQIKKVLLVK